ncbi:alpha/beta fold hydrolase [Pseudonocardiaceae bacterium YIM PH 21723]|nr:alpha/beta fold hydrolase [Pseudonocardiaceae bacterium YIM PH 21723]
MAGVPVTVHGTLCRPTGRAYKKAAVQLLLAGSTYGSDYWDVTGSSYRRAMNAAGYATLSVDRLGTGGSSHPVSTLLTGESQAEAVHQVVRALRAGRFGRRYDTVITVGHSYGSAIAMIEAGRYRDVDGAVLTGISHRPNLAQAVALIASLYPANLDRRFAARRMDPGYLTTRPGTRYRLFHAPGHPAQSLVDADERGKELFAATELEGVAEATLTPYSRRIEAPVLLVNGTGDPLFCGAPLLATRCSAADRLTADERPYYGPRVRLDAVVVPGYGHSINYAPNAGEYFARVTRWTDGVVAAHT